MKYLKHCLCSLVTCLPVICVAQALNFSDYHDHVKSFQTPTAASLGNYGNIPVDLYTGTPNISVPLTTVTSSSISVPISLSYDATGVKINQIPGWAGLNWNLVCGGQITRKVNYIQDEFNNHNPNVHSDQGYYFTGIDLNTTQWNTTSFMKGKLNAYQAMFYSNWVGLQMDGEPDEFQFQFGDYSGSFYRSEQGEWKVKSKQNLVLDISSEIVSDGTYKLYSYESQSSYEYVASLFTKFTITTPDGYKYIFGGNQNAIEFSRGPISGKQGLENFPNPYVEDRKNYITANSWYLTQIISPLDDTVKFTYKRGQPVFQKYRSFVPGFSDGPNVFSSPIQYMRANVTNPSYLQSVETPSTRVDFTTSTAVEMPLTEDIIPGNPPISTSTFKGYYTLNWTDLAIHFGIPNSSTFPHYNQQLDSIKIFDKSSGSYVMGFKLWQSASPNTRRTLDSVGIFGIATNTGLNKYKFSYDNVSGLPSSYETLARDHYGLNNGAVDVPLGSSMLPDRTPSSNATKGLISKIIYPTGGETDFIFEPGAYASSVKFDPNNSANPVQLISDNGNASVRIRKITSIAGFNAPPVTKEYFYTKNYASGGTTSSGILAMKLPYYANQGYVDQVTYHVDWGSSGTMPPNSECNGTYTEFNNADDNSEWLGMVHGGIVTYSEVTEKLSDGSYKVFKYTNSDNPDYRDQIQDNFAAADASWLDADIMEVTSNNNFRISSKDMDRGNILSETDYNPSGEKVKDDVYKYVNDPLRTNQYIPAFAHKEFFTPKNCGNFVPGSVPRGWAYRVYYYKNPVASVTENLYANGEKYTTVTKYAYDQYYNVTEKSTKTSDKRIIRESTRYSSNPAYQGTASSADAIGVNRLFTVYGIKNYPVEQTTTIAPDPDYGAATPAQTLVNQGTVYTYNQQRPVVSKVYKLELTEPFQAYLGSGGIYTSNYDTSRLSGGNFIYDTRYKLQQVIAPYSFNNRAKAARIQDANKAEAYTWDYQGSFITSVTQNGIAKDAAYTSFEGSYRAYGANDDNKGNWDYDPTQLAAGISFTGKKALILSSGPPVSTGIVSKTALPSGVQYELTFWARTNVPVVMNGTALEPSRAPVKTINGWKLFVYPLLGTGQKVSVVSASTSQPGTLITYLDEVRLHRIGTYMKSYTYDWVTGNITSVDDEKNKVVFYQYDALGRLIQVKDEDGNIVKQNGYALPQ